MLTTEVLTFKQIVTAATHVLAANKLPISRLRALLFDAKLVRHELVGAGIAWGSVE